MKKEEVINNLVIEKKLLKNFLVITIFTALSVALPFLAHHYHLAGTIFLPMHFFVLLAGLIYGRKIGFIVGALMPIISLTLSGMPPLSMIPVMSLEISAYGFFAGFFREKGLDSFTVLVLAIILGRIILFFSAWALLDVNPANFFFNALKLGIVGISLQLSLVPFLAHFVREYLRNY